MGRFIKSHSNYVLKSKHQTTNDGTIWERDITTIGALNQFSPGQMPIYQSSNFIISVRGDSKVRNQYNSTNWDENENSGTVWTLDAIEGLVSEDDRQDDTKIVLKQDYYDLRDFAYYGSLTELFRASVSDIVSRFPGELYCTNNPIYYTHKIIESGERVEYSERLGGDELTEVSNPFNIDIHSKSLPNDANYMKFFANEGFKNYMMFSGETYDDTIEDDYAVSEWEVEYEGDCVKPGEKFATITIKNNNGLVVEIEGWFGDQNTTIYLSKNQDIHIRPLKSFMTTFYNECDNFEYLLMNPKSTPLYSTVFSVIRENEFGYYRELETFEFPKTYGGYNIDVSDYGFNGYTDKMVEIGEYYDEYFSDNLYRSMTHEALKNFDWTYTKEYNPGEEEEYVIGGERFKKAMRVFAREFDEILSYINAITSTNIVTYDQRNNIPDYFLTDVVENEGWDVKLVIPYNLTEYYYDNDGSKKEVDKYIEGDYCSGQLGNTYETSCDWDGLSINGETQPGSTKKHITREFSQKSAATIKPYTKELLGDFKDGWFIVCGDGTCDCDSLVINGESTGGDVSNCKYCGEGTNYHYIPTSGATKYYDGNALSKDGAIKNRIKPFTDEREYTYLDANNEFLRRLKLNSRAIWRHKGTIDGLEMILGMFGLKSKRWCDSLYTGCCPENKPEPDYDVTEYTSFAHRVEEQWDAVHQRYRIEWLNSTKTITYDNRFVSIYNQYGRNDRIFPYQGIPVSYRDEYEYPTSGIASSCSQDEGYSPYIKISRLEDQINGGVSGTSNINDAFKCIEDNNAPVLRRYLYPHFNKNEQLDGNPYFQMNGGWHSNIVQDSSGNTYNFQYDVDNNIVFTEYNYDSSGDTLYDNERLYKETVRNIRTVDSVAELLRLPGVEIFDGMVCHVASIETNSIVIDDSVYTIKREYYKGEDAAEGVYEYVSLIKDGGSIRVGSDKYFDTTIIVYDRNGEEATYDVSSKPTGYEVRAYIVRKGDDVKFMCKEDSDGYYSIDSYQLLNGDSDENLTHYFKITDSSFYNRLAKGEIVLEEDGRRRYNWTDGWRRLDKSDKEYLKINTIHNYYEGNNPHNGNMRYDSGHEYLTYFKRIFKHAHDNDLFDERCYEDYFNTYDTEIPYIGFSGLIEDNEDVLQYDKFLNPDTKIHFFGNHLNKDEETGAYTRYIYGENCERLKNFEVFYSGDTTDDIRGYILSANTNDGWVEEYNPYNPEETSCPTVSAGTIDEVTNQIVNNKRFEIVFYLHEEWYTKEGQEELKYLDDIVSNYLTQMLPSTVIYSVKYTNKQEKEKKVLYKWNSGTASVDCDENDNTINATITGEKITIYEDL